MRGTKTSPSPPAARGSERRPVPPSAMMQLASCCRHSGPPIWRAVEHPSADYRRSAGTRGTTRAAEAEAGLSLARGDHRASGPTPAGPHTGQRLAGPLHKIPLFRSRTSMSARPGRLPYGPTARSQPVSSPLSGDVFPPVVRLPEPQHLPDLAVREQRLILPELPRHRHRGEEARRAAPWSECSCRHCRCRR